MVHVCVGVRVTYACIRVTYVCSRVTNLYDRVAPSYFNQFTCAYAFSVLYINMLTIHRWMCVSNEVLHMLHIGIQAVVPCSIMLSCAASCHLDHQVILKSQHATIRCSVHLFANTGGDHFSPYLSALGDHAIFRERWPTQAQNQ